MAMAEVMTWQATGVDKMKELDLNTGLSTSSLRALGLRWRWLVVGIAERSSSQEKKNSKKKFQFH